MSEWGLVNMILTEGVVRRVIGCVGRGRVAIGSCYRERRNGRRRREGEQGGGGSGKEERGEEEERRKGGRRECLIQAAGWALKCCQVLLLVRCGYSWPNLSSVLVFA